MSPGMRRQAGFSLVELAVSLTIAAVLTGLLFVLLPLARQAAGGHPQERQLQEAEEALLGYSLTHFRLPYADSDGDGLADNATSGWLPVRTLGLPSRMRLRYEVEPSLATTPVRQYVPHLPDDFVGSLSTAPNGLDMCMRLFQAQRMAGILGALQLPAAYALAASNGVGHDAAAPSAIALPGTDAAASQPVLAVAAGHGELAARMACPELLARAHGAAQAANAAHSIALAQAFTRDFRVFDKRIAQLVKSQSETGLAFASLGLAMGIFDEVMAILLTAAGWPPAGLSIAIGIGEHVVAGTSIGLSIASIVWANDDLESAKEGITKAEDVLKEAEANKARMDQLRLDSAAAALRLEKGGSVR